MLNFTYDIKYDVSSFNTTKRKIEGAIRGYLLGKFKLYAEWDIQIMLLPNSSFQTLKCIALAIPSEKIIKINFDTFSNYFVQLKRHHNQSNLPVVRKAYNNIFHNLHHEMQHIINHIEYREVFAYINSMNCSSYIKVAISNILDEYLASYSTQKQFFSKSGAVDGGLASLCEKKEFIVTEREIHKIDLFVDIFTFLAYAIAECKVLNKNNIKIDSFNIILENESVIDFIGIFSNIRNLLECFNPQQYKDYSDQCYVEVNTLLTLLNVDFGFLEEIGQL